MSPKDIIIGIVMIVVLAYIAVVIVQDSRSKSKGAMPKHPANTDPTYSVIEMLDNDGK